MTKDELNKIKEHIEIHARLEPRAVYITQILWKAVAELERIAELEHKLEQTEKENEELKARLNAINLLTPELKKQSKLKKQKLAEAKEIIKELCSMVRELNKPNVQLTDVDYSLVSAEQFLKECE